MDIIATFNKGSCISNNTDWFRQKIISLGGTKMAGNI